MDDTQILQKLQKILKSDLEAVTTVLVSGGVDKIDNYKYLVGQVFTIKRISQEISNLLQPKEPKNEQGTVIDIGNARSNTKN